MTASSGVYLGQGTGLPGHTQPSVITGNEYIVLKAVCCPIVSQAQACVGLFVLQHTQKPLCPLQRPSRSCEHLCPSQFTRSGMHSERNCPRHIAHDAPSQGRASLWECPGLSNIPPPTWPRKASKLRPALVSTFALQRWDFLGNDIQSHRASPFVSF